MKVILTILALAASVIAAPVAQGSYASYGDYAPPAGGYASYGTYSGAPVPAVNNPPAPAGGYGAYGDYGAYKKE